MNTIPDLKALHSTIKDRDDVALLGISLDKDGEIVKDVVSQKSMDWEHGIVGEIQSTREGAALGISSVPLYLVLNPEGVILARSHSFEEASSVLLGAIKSD